MPDPVSIFFLYAPEDEALRAALEKHLSLLKLEGLVVTPGAEWRSEIERRIDEAQIVLVLISADFIASDSYDVAMQHALERHRAGKATVIPVLARPVDWSMGPFHDLAPIDDVPLVSHDNLDAALAEVAAKLRQVIKDRSRNPRLAHRLHAPSR